MKTKNIFLLFICFALSSCISICKTQKEHRIEPELVITTNWSLEQYKNTGYYKDYFDQETIDCFTTYIIDKDFYKFNVYTKNDTVKINIHNSYVGSNVDSIYIFINKTFDTSKIIVHPDCSWVRIGTIKTLVGNACTFNCEVSSNISVFINVFLIVNSEKKNVNPSWRDYDKNAMDLFIEGNYKQLDSLIKNRINTN
ncbi:MAG: hypothetical protein J6T88_03245 [Bacteroidales bacterium]|nr:hypothetical protein [Bacteroidales bacterium]